MLECYLHGFGDASNKAYCAVVYFVCRTWDGVHIRLLTSRSRVAPLKELTIHRLEVMSAGILAQLMSKVKNALEEQVTLNGTRYWLDSKTAICWIQNRGQWKQFVRHRVNKILKLSAKDEWRHRLGKDNPVDIGSRGALGSKLKWKGPPSLTREESSTPESQEQMKKTSTVMIVDVQDSASFAKVIDIEQHGTLRKLLTVTVWVLRFVQNSKPRCAKRKGRLKREELINAETEWVKAAQRDLKRQKNFPNSESVLGLEKVGDVLRCFGRLEHSDLEVEAQKPIILPKDHAYTTKTIEECHERVLHGGVRETLAELRSKFWVLKGRQHMKKVISKCIVCRKLEGKAYSTPRSAALPEFRVTEVPAFSKVGVDFTGPLYIKERTTRMKKVYIGLFSCCATQAIHLELVEDLSTGAFIRALQRFAGRRGTQV